MPTNAKYGTTTAGIFSDDGLESKLLNGRSILMLFCFSTVFSEKRRKEPKKHSVYVLIIGQIAKVCDFTRDSWHIWKEDTSLQNPFARNI